MLLPFAGLTNLNILIFQENNPRTARPAAINRRRFATGAGHKLTKKTKKTMKTTNTNKWSKNAKLNALLSEIEDDLRNMCDTEEKSLEDIRRYMQEFPKEKDYNLVNYGNLLVYFVQVRDLYKSCGYKSIDRMNDTNIWDTYRRQVGYVAREIVKMK